MLSSTMACSFSDSLFSFWSCISVQVPNHFTIWLSVFSREEGVYISDDKGYILYTNTAEDKIFGYETGELIGKHVTVQNAYDENENIAKVNNTIEYLKTNGSWSGEWHNKRKDGTTFFTYSHISALPIDGTTYFVCVQRDITEEKHAKESLIESETR